MPDGLQPEQIEAIGRIWRLADREVWIVTAEHAGSRGGLVATWVSPVTLEPADPLMLIALAPNHFTAALIDGGGGFTLHLLAPEQTEIAWNFALGSGRERDKFAGLEVRSAQRGGGPLLPTALTWLECRVAARLATGDRTFYWGRVEGVGPIPEIEPLREQALFASASPEQQAAARAGMQADIARHRTWREAWLADLPDWLRP